MTELRARISEAAGFGRSTRLHDCVCCGQISAVHCGVAFALARSRVRVTPARRSRVHAGAM